jgi:hypothetical protein
MAARRPTAKPAKKTAPGPTSVVAFLSQLEHPHKAGVESLRRAILTLDERITEEIKWNAPSFKLNEHFATFKLHPPTQIQLVLHTGSKPIVPTRQFTLDAPAGLLKWAAPDRCVLSLKSTAAAQARETDVVNIVRAWIEQL